MKLTRRGFLGSILGIAATPVLASIPMFEHETARLTLSPTISAYPALDRIGIVQGLKAYGRATSPEIGYVRILRGGNLIALYDLNTFGGILMVNYWDNPLYFLDGVPIVIDASPNVIVDPDIRYIGKNGKWLQ